MMTIVCDERIPGIQDWLGAIATVRALPGNEISRSELVGADALFVRSVTQIDPALLDGTSVKFIGSATAGTDHIDFDGLSGADITIEYAGGSNAPAVCDYVLAALFELGSQQHADPFGLTVGIVGVGHVGGAVEKRLSDLGIETLVSDAPIHDKLMSEGKPSRFIPLHDLLRQVDVLTVHVPLTNATPHPTRHLIGRPELENLNPEAWIFNTSRGYVVDEESLLEAIESGAVSGAVIDTWQDEPSPNCDLVRVGSITTPHIGAYALESKTRATEAIVNAFATWAGKDITTANPARTRTLPLAVPPTDVPDHEFCTSVIRQAYDIGRDHLRMQGMCSFPAEKRTSFFRDLRDTYRFRNEFSSFGADATKLSARHEQLLAGLSIQVLGS